MAFPPASLPTNHADGDVITAAAENTANAAVNDVVTELVAYEASNNTAVSGKAASVHAHAESDVTGLTADLTLKAPLASPALTGTPTAPTAAGGTNTTQVATTAFVKTAADAKVADAINDSTTTVAPSQNAVFDALALKANLASPTLTGTPLAPTAAQGTNTTQIATTAYVQTEAGLLVPKSLVDAKGDLLAGSADNTVGRLAVGTNGHVLTADSAETLGVKWAAAGGGSSAWTVVYEDTLVSTAASVTISSLGAYGDFILYVDGRCTSTGDDFAHLLMRMNADTGNNYEQDRVVYTNLVGSGSSGPSRTAATSLTGSMVIGYVGGSKTNTDRNGTVLARFSSRGTASRMVSWESVVRYASTAAIQWAEGRAVWRTTSDITSIDILPEVFSLAAGTYIRLLGRA